MIGYPHLFAVRPDTHGDRIDAGRDTGHDLLSSRINDIQGIGGGIDDEDAPIMNRDWIQMRTEERGAS